MLDDTDRLLGTVEQVLKAGEAGYKIGARHSVELDFGASGSRLHRPGAHASSPGCRALKYRRRSNANDQHPSCKAIRKNCAPLFRICSTTPSSILETRWKFPSVEKRRMKSARCCACGTAEWAFRPNELKRIFKRFYRVPGRARIEGERDGPRTFHRARRRPSAWRQSIRRERRRRQGHHGDARAAPERRRMSRVLVVEDEAHLAEGLRFNLEAEGHSVEAGGRWRIRCRSP